MILFDFFLIWQEKLNATTSSLQFSEAENELQSECYRNPLSKALLLMHMAGQAVTSKSHVGTERQTQLLQAWCFTRIYFSLVQLHCTVTPFWFSILHHAVTLLCHTCLFCWFCNTFVQLHCTHVCHTFVSLHHELSSTYYCFYVTYCITHSYLYIKHSHFCITHSYFLSFMSHTAFTFPCTTELYVSHTLVITVNIITLMSHYLTAGKPRAHSFAKWQQQERTWHCTCLSHLLVITVTLLRSATPSYSVSDNYRKAKSWLSNANSRNERCPVGTDRQTLPVMTHLQMCLLLLFFFTAVLLCWCLNQLLSNTKVEKR